ncbi:SctK family type III secretion system sorting platform protein BscK [Bordetella bronchiseptica]|uniref:Uncharacterized protein n=2 Tax=Bordetella bronchiseptica TaxID=518 RepID=A0A0C6P6J4_BORBO|nr:SctK family type III secretion system sorting platform protein BscK [Bordetella bronchiseptica]SHR45177.1 Uncharacterised protein [Mycobacteroides abscessus subsp. abscessus]AWP74429.1 hypothetical protein B7P10_08120 [Bordetella bronchiseptica]AZW21229.1 hypothetical protein CS345_08050 [Bordetella bronchiseptica]KCV31151.1 hypothetical protein L490_1414 [Bordetella bronchiseptica 00-P-2796]KDB99947.1 hypothetical protein AZ23_1698 [Bordetella bronchiseptica E010]
MTEKSVLLSERLMIFNLLPSLTLHASRHDETFPADWVRALCNADAALANAWHRHWSRWILCELGLLNQPVLSLDPPQLKVALLSTDALRTCAAHAGALLCAPRLRRAIDGAEVRTLHAALGRDVMNFAVSSAARALHDGLAASSDWTLAATVQAAQKLGWALLRDAVQGAADEIALRCALKLPRDLDPAPVLPPEEALALALSMLEILDAEWLSSFPAQA